MFTIGEFSKLCQVSARMLRHYDRLGLLRPAFTSPESGYRYYDQTQLPVLNQIETLKRYGFSLAEIRELLPLSSGELSGRIHTRRLQVYGELNNLRRTLHQMEDDIIEMEGVRFVMEKYHVIIMENPAQKVLGLRRTIDIGQVHELFQELHALAKREGLTQSGPTQLVYLGKEFSYQSMDVEAQVQVNGESPLIRELPACTCIATTHVGPYEALRHGYDALTAWMAAHPEYQVCGPGIERYLKDENMADSSEALETGLLFPVKKIQ